MVEKFNFLVQEGIYRPPKHKGNGQYRASLTDIQDKGCIKLEDNSFMKFDGHDVMFAQIEFELEPKKFAVQFLGAERRISTQISSGLFIWTPATSNMSPLHKERFFEPGQGILTFPDVKQNNFLLWTLVKS